MSKNPPDLWARLIGALGIAIGLCGLGLTYYNNRWQKEAYDKSLEERIFVRLNGLLSYRFASLLPHDTEPPPKGELEKLAVEVVNLGLQPIYIKSITAQFGEHRTSFYEHDPLNTKEPMPRLEPGEAASYEIELPFEAGGTTLLEYIDKANATVEVETTKKWFSQKAQINARFNSVTIKQVLELPLTARRFQLKKLIPKPGRHK